MSDEIKERVELETLLENICERIEKVEDHLSSKASATNLKVSQMPTVTPALTSDFLPMVRNTSGTYSNAKITIQEVIDLIPGTGSYDPFDAKITSDSQDLLALLSEGKVCINMASDYTTETDTVNIINDTTLYFSPGFSFSTPSFNISAGKTLKLIGCGVGLGDGSTGNILNLSNTESLVFFQGSGQFEIHNMCIVAQSVGGGFTNIRGLLNNCVYINPPSSSAYPLYLTVEGSSISNTTIDSKYDTNFPILRLSKGTVGSNITIINNSGASNNLVTVDQGAEINQLIINKGSYPLTVSPTITNNGKISGINTVGSITPVALLGANAILSDCQNFNGAITLNGNKCELLDSTLTGNIVISSGVSSAKIIGCDGTGTYTDSGTNTITIGNSGTIPDTGSNQPSVLTEGSTSVKISAMPDPTTLQTTDKFPVVRNVSGTETNYAAPLSELVDLIPGGAPSILMETGSSQKISQMDHLISLELTDIVPLIRYVDDSPTNYTAAIEEIINLVPVTSSLPFFDAKVDGVGTNPNTYATINEALTALGAGNHVIEVTANTTLIGNIVLAGAVTFYTIGGVTIDLDNYTIDCNQKNLTFLSKDGQRYTISFNPDGSYSISNSVGRSVVKLVDGIITNPSTADNRTLCDPNSVDWQSEGCIYHDGPFLLCCINLNSINSYANDCTIVLNTSSTTSLQLSGGSTARNITFDNGNDNINFAFEIDPGCYLDGLFVVGAFPVLGSCYGNLNNVMSVQAGGQVNLTIESFGSNAYPVITNSNLLSCQLACPTATFLFSCVTFNELFHSAAGSGPVSLVACNDLGTYTNLSGNISIAACKGSIV